MRKVCEKKVAHVKTPTIVFILDLTRSFNYEDRKYNFQKIRFCHFSVFMTKCSQAKN